MNKPLPLALPLSGFWSDKEVPATRGRQKLFPGLSNSNDECQARACVCVCDMRVCEHVLEHVP